MEKLDGDVAMPRKPDGKPAEEPCKTVRLPVGPNSPEMQKKMEDELKKRIEAGTHWPKGDPPNSPR